MNIEDKIYVAGHRDLVQAAYLNARQIKDLGLRHRPGDGNQVDQPPAPPPK